MQVNYYIGNSIFCVFNKRRVYANRGDRRHERSLLPYDFFSTFLQWNRSRNHCIHISN